MKPEFTLRKIREEFPEIKWKKHRFLTGGYDHITVLLDKKIIFRIPKARYYKKEFTNEIPLLRYLRGRVSIGIPEYKYVSKDMSFAGYEMLEGKELTASRFQNLTASEKNIVAKQLAEFITALHKTPRAIIRKCKVRKENQLKNYKEFARDVKRILFSRLSENEVNTIMDFLYELKATLSHNHPNVLVHNDLGGEHILWDSKNKQINIIDFSDRVIGDPASDFTGLHEYGNEFVKKVFDLYDGKKDKQMLYRSRLYYKRIPIFIMKDSFQGYPCKFKDGYRLFKKRFEFKAL